MSISYKSCLNNLSACKAGCCRNGVWVDLEQSRSIEKEILSNPEFKDLHGKDLFADAIDDLDYFPSGKAVGTALKTEDGPCVFLGEDYKCRIYLFRPYFCADYPFMHPLLTSKEPILLDTLFESDETCIYNQLMQDTLRSIEDEKTESSQL